MDGAIPSTSSISTPRNVGLLSTSSPPGASSLLNLPIDVVETIIPLLTDTEDFNNFIDAIHSDSRSNIYDDLITREYEKRLKRRNEQLLKTKIYLEKMQKICEDQKQNLDLIKTLNKQRRRKRRRL